jgi:hypothetical protein
VHSMADNLWSSILVDIERAHIGMPSTIACQSEDEKQARLWQCRNEAATKLGPSLVSAASAYM